jgi:hypothetical protein
MTERATTAARELATVLLEHADALASDELETVSAAMTAVRAAAREVEAALTERGWGGGVLYGFGDPHHDQEGNDDEDTDAADDVFDGLVALDGDDEDWVVPTGTRMTYQARYDFVVVDPEALAAHAERRAAELGWAWKRGADGHPFDVLMHADGLGSRDYDSAGLAFAGGQEASREITATLWELDDEDSDDMFPTSH